MPEQEKKNVELNHLPFTIFEILKRHWGGKSTNGKPPLKTKDAYELMKKPFEKLRRYLSIQTLRNNLRAMAKDGILLKDPLESKRGGGGKTTFYLNWQFLNEHDVVRAPITSRNKWHQRKPAGPIPPPEEDEDSNEQADSYLGPPKPIVRRLQIMLALPDLRTETQTKKNPLGRAIEELSKSSPRILCTESDIENIKDGKNKLGLEAFKLLYPDENDTMRSKLPTMFHKGSHLEIVLREKEEGKKKVKYLAIIARLAMDCILNGERMETDQEYPLAPNVPNLLVIDDRYEYIVRALGF